MENKIFPLFSVCEPPIELPMMNLNIWSDKYKFSYENLEKIKFTTKQKNQLYSNISRLLKGEVNLETMVIDLEAIKELKFNKKILTIISYIYNDTVLKLLSSANNGKITYFDKLVLEKSQFNNVYSNSINKMSNSCLTCFENVDLNKISRKEFNTTLDQVRETTFSYLTGEGLEKNDNLFNLKELSGSKELYVIIKY